jgi:hypothetical protein
MPSPGMWRREDLVWTDVSEESIASIFRVKNREQGTSVSRCYHRSQNLKSYNSRIHSVKWLTLIQFIFSYAISLTYRTPESPFCDAVYKSVSITDVHFRSSFNNSYFAVVRSRSILCEAHVAVCRISVHVSLSDHLYSISFYFPIDAVSRSQ